MLKKEQIELFLGEFVSVGVPHLVVDDKLFFYYGRIIKVDENEVTLQTRSGYKIIPVAQIQDIHRSNWGMQQND